MTEVSGAYVTAMGAVTAHGLGVAPFVSAIVEARSAIAEAQSVDTRGLCSHVAAEVTAALPAGEGRATRLLAAAIDEAALGRDLTPNRRRGAVLGTTKGTFDRWLDHNIEPVGTLTAWFANRVGAQGPVLPISAACASSTFAIGRGLQLLRAGHCDEVWVAGVDAVHPFVYAGFHALKALSPRPAAPFDVHRAGLTLGEGAGVLVLERRASRDGFGEVLGFGAASDGFDQTAPHPDGEGLVTAFRRALASAGIDANRVTRYHAHGTATFHNDRMEARAHHQVLGGGVPVTAIKGSIGHTLGAAGVLDAIACLATMRRQTIPAVCNLVEVDPDLNVPATTRAIADPGGLALLATAGFGGLNAALVLA